MDSRLCISARKRLLKLHYEAGVGHLGGNLSCLDLLLCIHHCALGVADMFILSKGHSAGALYITLWTLGKIPEGILSTFHGEGTQLSGHPAADFLPEIPFSTGSLGHGLGLAAGVALAFKLKKQLGRVYCLISDGEINEGSIWEALLFIAHHKLNVCVIVDKNGLQGFGKTSEVLNSDPLRDKFEALGYAVSEIDGHDFEAIAGVLKTSPGLARVVIANTIKGKGVPLIEDQMKSHYLPLEEGQYQEAMKILEDL
ncbi:1-deoxy-D-xylulose-5-phosphate synthase N-terminal domain-containing protein [Bdellovibrionota bacterium FG-2]